MTSPCHRRGGGGGGGVGGLENRVVRRGVNHNLAGTMQEHFAQSCICVHETMQSGFLCSPSSYPVAFRGSVRFLIDFHCGVDSASIVVLTLLARGFLVGLLFSLFRLVLVLLYLLSDLYGGVDSAGLGRIGGPTSLAAPFHSCSCSSSLSVCFASSYFSSLTVWWRCSYSVFIFVPLRCLFMFVSLFGSWLLFIA